MSVNGAAAARTMAGFAPLAHHGACLHYVWQAYKAQGASTGRSAYDALEAWGKTDGHRTDGTPPAGVPVWFGAKASSSAGDVVISLGGGRVIATDYPAYGQVGECTIEQRQAQIGRPYLGWSTHIFDQPIGYTTPAGEEDDMPTAQEVAEAVWNYSMNGGKALSGGQQVPAETGGERLRQVRRSTHQLRARTITTVAEVQALSAAVEALSTAHGVDPATITETVRQAVDAALDGLSITLTANDDD